MNHPHITVHLEIAGLVQGVGFRHSLQAVAGSLELRGWVRNSGNGHVEAIIQGLEADVEHLIAWCHNGPPNARVESVQSDLLANSEIFAAFTQRPSG